MRRRLSLNENWLAAPGTVFDTAPSALPKGLVSPAQAGLQASDRNACWWFLPFDLDASWDAAETELHLNGATRPFRAWVNGKPVGECATAFVPAEFVLTRHLRTGANLIAVCLLGIEPPARGGAAPAWDSDIDPRFHTPPAILGDTTLAGFPGHRIERVLTWPDLRKKQVEVEVHTTAPGTLHLNVDGVSVEAPCGDAATRLSIELPNAPVWAPGAPATLRLRVDYLSEAQTADRVEVDFGIRELSVKEEQFHINARPIELRGVWHAPAALPEQEGARRDRAQALLSSVRDARLNSVRLLWADSAVLQAADEAGLVVFLQLPHDLDAHAAEAIVQAYHHHPSLAGYWLNGAETSVVRQLWQHDATRLTLVSGAGPDGAPCYYRPRKQQAEPVQSFTLIASPPYPMELESYWRRIGADGHLVLVEALSAFGLDAAPEIMPAGLDGICETPADLLSASLGMQSEAIRYPLDALRLNSRVAGYWLQGLTPFPAWPNSALHDADGAPRPAFRILEPLHRAMRPVIQMEKSSLCVREEVRVNIALLNDARIEGRGELFLQVIGPTNQVLWKKRRQLRIPRHGKELWIGSVAASGSTGRHKFVVRLMQDEKVLGDSVYEFHVMEAPPEALPKIHVIDPKGEWEPRLRSLARPDNILSPVHVLPAFGGSVFAAPENELMQSLAQVKGGAVLLVFGPTQDWNDLATRIDGLPEIEVAPLAGTGRLIHSYSRLHPMWEGLPTRAFLRQPYREIVPNVGLLGESDESIAGWYAPDSAGESPCHTVLATRYGQGRIVFVSFRLLENLSDDPLAARAFSNLVQHFARRAMAPRQPLPLEQPVVEWHRQQRKERLRRWAVIGEFPNPNGAGYGTAYPPEQEFDPEAAYPGWRSLVRWNTHYSHATEEHRIDFAQVFAPPAQQVPRQDFSAAYAYTEFNSDRRLTASLTLASHNAAKVWLNGKLVIEQPKPHECTEAYDVETEAIIKQGRNVMLVKLAKAPGPFWFQADWTDHRGNLLPLTWWR